MALVVVSMTEKSSVIVSGQLMSETLKPALSSFESTLAGLNAKTAERSEQLVTLRWLSTKYPSQYASTYTEYMSRKPKSLAELLFAALIAAVGCDAEVLSLD